MKSPLEQIWLPLKRRAALPPLLAGLQWLWLHRRLKAEIFALLEAKIIAGKQATGRTGMALWQILVWGVVRFGLDADWDRLEDLANQHLRVRQRLGVPATPWGEDAKVFGHQMPKRGKENAAETERESGKQFVALRQQHRAVASELNSREHHGWNRGFDMGIKGDQRYLGDGWMSYNRHVIGRELLARQRARGETLALAAFHEMFTKKSSATTCWGLIDLGTSLVQVQVPVTYRC